MSLLLNSLSVLLHDLATTIFIGYYLLLALIYLPALGTKDPAILSEISKRSRPWLYASLLVFAITGVYLTFVDFNYLGLANFGNPWSILMLLKHLLVLGMIAIGFWFNAILRVGPMLNSNHRAAKALGHFRLYANLMAIFGLSVLLLTAFAQFE